MRGCEPQHAGPWIALVCACAQEQLKESHLRYSEQARHVSQSAFAISWSVRQISRLSASCRQAEDRKGAFLLGPGEKFSVEEQVAQLKTELHDMARRHCVLSLSVRQVH